MSDLTQVERETLVDLLAALETLPVASRARVLSALEPVPPDLVTELAALSRCWLRSENAERAVSMPAKSTHPGEYDSLCIEADAAELALRAQVLAVLRVFGGVEHD